MGLDAFAMERPPNSPNRELPWPFLFLDKVAPSARRRVHRASRYCINPSSRDSISPGVLDSSAMICWNSSPDT